MNYIRINAAFCGSILGKKALMVERNPVDPGYSDAKKNSGLCLNRPIWLYSIKPIEISSVELVTTANGGERVEFNHDAKLRLDIANVDDITKVIPNPNAATVRAAIEKYERSNKEDITIFVDYEKLLREVIALNLDEKKTYSAWLSQQMKFCGTLSEANETEIAACKMSMKELGVEISF